MAQNISFDVIARDKASSTFSKISKSSTSTEGTLKKFGSTASKALGFLGVAGATAGVISFFKDANAEAREAQKVGALSVQVIKSTGGAAKVSAQHVGDLATAISNKIGVDDEAIQSGENLLLTFKNIRNEAGRGNKIFDQATKAAVDLGAGLAAASGGEINFKSASTLVGKALNDPIKGLTALRKVGVDFTKGQQDQIKKLVESGKTMKAQKIILKELKSEFGGAAKSQATESAKAGVAVGNLKEQIGTALLPVVDRLAKFTSSKAVPAISKFVTGMQDGTGAGGKFASVVKDLAGIAKGAVSFLNGLPGPVKKFGIEGLIAYGVIRKLGPAVGSMGESFTTGVAKVKQFNAEMSYSATRMQAVKGGAQAMGGMLRNVAGAGGMLLLADSAGRANTKLGLLESAAGGALSGAALGAFAGPVGAGVGAAIGGLAAGALTLFRNTKSAGSAASDAIGKWQSYAATLDQVTGATTEATRAKALQTAADAGLLKTTRSLGIGDRQVVNALVNGGKARDGVIAAVKREVSAVDESIAAKKRELASNIAIANDMSVPLAQQTAAANRVKANRLELEDLAKLRVARKKDADNILKGVGAVQKSVTETQRNAAATNDLTGKLKGIPRLKATQIKAEGILPTTKGIIALSEKYKLTPKQVKTVIAASGVPMTQKQIDRLVATVVAYGKLSPTAKLYADTAAAATKIQALINGIARIKDKTVHITAVTNANVAEHAGTRGHGHGGGGSSPRVGGDAQRVLDDSMRGAATQTMSIKKALAKFGGALSKVTDSLASLKDLRQSFLDTFQGDNLFGADISGGGGAGALVDFEAKQAAQATQLLADIQNVAGRGLSKALISQLQSQGTSGALQLHAIATGSNEQIGQLNAYDNQTSTALQAAGMFAGNTVRGGSIDSDVAAAQREEKLLDRLVKRLEELQDGKYIVVEIEGEQIVKAIRKRNKNKGVDHAAGV